MCLELYIYIYIYQTWGHFWNRWSIPIMELRKFPKKKNSIHKLIYGFYHLNTYTWYCQYTGTKMNQNFGSLLCFSGRIPRLWVIQHRLFVGVDEKIIPRHSQGSITERSPNTLRIPVFYVLRGSLTSSFIFNNLVETALPFNVVVRHPRCCEPRKETL